MVHFLAVVGAASVIVKLVRVFALYRGTLPPRVEEPTAEEMGWEHAMQMMTDRLHINPPWECWCGAEEILPGDGQRFLSVWVHKGPGDEPASSREIAKAISDAIAGRKDM